MPKKKSHEGLRAKVRKVVQAKNPGLKGRLKGGFLTKHHPEVKKGEMGGDIERKAILQWRAMELNIQGKSLRAIALQLQEEFELQELPAFKTIDNWLDAAYAEAMSAKQAEAVRHCQVIFTRAEEMVAELMPLAKGQMVIERTVMSNGERVRVIDEDVIRERLAAMGEIRKWLEMEAKLLKIGRVGEEASNPQLSGNNLNVLIERMVSTHIVIPGAGSPEVPALTLSSGDVDVDRMDAESLVMEG